MLFQKAAKRNDFCGFIADFTGRDFFPVVSENWFLVGEKSRKDQGIYIIWISGNPENIVVQLEEQRLINLGVLRFVCPRGQIFFPSSFGLPFS